MRSIADERPLVQQIIRLGYHIYEPIGIVVLETSNLRPKLAIYSCMIENVFRKFRLPRKLIFFGFWVYKNLVFLGEIIILLIYLIKIILCL